MGCNHPADSGSHGNSPSCVVKENTFADELELSSCTLSEIMLYFKVHCGISNSNLSQSPCSAVYQGFCSEVCFVFHSVYWLKPSKNMNPFPSSLFDESQSECLRAKEEKCFSGTVTSSCHRWSVQPKRLLQGQKATHVCHHNNKISMMPLHQAAHWLVAVLLTQTCVLR